MHYKGNHFAADIDWMKSFWLAAEMPGNEISLRKQKHENFFFATSSA